MEFELEWVHPSLLICRTSGAATVEGFIALFQAMRSHPQFRPGMNVLADHSSLDVSSITASEIEQVADMRARLVRETGARSALVIGPGSPMRYGLARMFEAYIEPQVETEVQVFETFDEAMAWLTEANAPVPSEPPE